MLIHKLLFGTYLSVLNIEMFSFQERGSTVQRCPHFSGEGGVEIEEFYSFQGVGIEEEFQGCWNRVYRDVLISGSLNREVLKWW